MNIATQDSQQIYQQLDQAIEFLKERLTFNDGNYVLILHVRIFRYLRNIDQSKIEITSVISADDHKNLGLLQRIKYRDLRFIVSVGEWLIASDKRFVGYAFSPDALDTEEEYIDFMKLRETGEGLNLDLCFKISITD